MQEIIVQILKSCKIYLKGKKERIVEERSILDSVKEISDVCSWLTT